MRLQGAIRLRCIVCKIIYNLLNNLSRLKIEAWPKRDDQNVFLLKEIIISKKKND